MYNLKVDISSPCHDILRSQLQKLLDDLGTRRDYNSSGHYANPLTSVRYSYNAKQKETKDHDEHEDGPESMA